MGLLEKAPGVARIFGGRSCVSCHPFFSQIEGFWYQMPPMAMLCAGLCLPIVCVCSVSVKICLPVFLDISATCCSSGTEDHVCSLLSWAFSV